MTITTIDTPDAEALRIATDRQLAEQEHALPCIVQAVSTDGTTVDVIPAIRKTITLDGNRSAMPERVIRGVPIMLYGSTKSGLYVCPPIQAGDEGVIFAMDRALDNWQGGSGSALPPDLPTPRHNDFTDAVFYPGVQRTSFGISSFPSDAMTVQTKDGSTMASVKNGEVKLMVGSTSVVINNVGVTINGLLVAKQSMQVTGTVSGASGSSGLNIAVPLTVTGGVTSTQPMRAPDFIKV